MRESSLACGKSGGSGSLGLYIDSKSSGDNVGDTVGESFLYLDEGKAGGSELMEDLGLSQSCGLHSPAVGVVTVDEVVVSEPSVDGNEGEVDDNAAVGDEDLAAAVGSTPLACCMRQ